MKITTATGSTYEINTDSKRIRRISGKKTPALAGLVQPSVPHRIGQDGEWKTYEALIPEPLKVGLSAIILWGSDVAPLSETVAHGDKDEPISKITTTSPITEIEG